MTRMSPVVACITDDEKTRYGRVGRRTRIIRLPIELQALVDIYDQPFFVIDDAHRVVVVNRAFQKAFRTDGSTTAGTPCHQLMAAYHGPRPCGSQGHACPFAETFTHQVQRTSAFTYRDADGREHLLRTQAYPLRTHSGQTFVGVLMHQETLRDRPTAADGAGPSSSMVGRSPAFRAMLEHCSRRPTPMPRSCCGGRRVRARSLPPNSCTASRRATRAPSRPSTAAC